MKTLFILASTLQLSLALPQIEFNGGFQGPFGIGNQFCNLCPSSFCSGSGRCECENAAALSCYQISQGRCARPFLPTCGESPTAPGKHPDQDNKPQNPPNLPPNSDSPRSGASTSPQSQNPPCGKGLAACAAGTTCDRSSAKGCLDLSNSGNCIGVCMPNKAPVATPTSNRNPPRPPIQSPQLPQFTPALQQPSTLYNCRGPGIDSDCPEPGTLCIADPGAPKGAAVPGVCVRSVGTCGGTRAASCPVGRICVDDPRDSCDPALMPGCLGICI